MNRRLGGVGVDGLQIRGDTDGDARVWSFRGAPDTVTGIFHSLYHPRHASAQLNL